MNAKSVELASKLIKLVLRFPDEAARGYGPEMRTAQEMFDTARALEKALEPAPLLNVGDAVVTTHDVETEDDDGKPLFIPSGVAGEIKEVEGEAATIAVARALLDAAGVE